MELDLEENKRELQELNKKFLELEKAIGKAEDLQNELKNLEEKTLAQGFWNDSKTSNVVLRNIKEVKSKLTSVNEVKRNLNTLIETNDFLLIESDEEMALDLVKSTASLRKDIEKLETKMFLSGKFDKNNAIITLHPGARWNRVTRLGTNAL